MKKILGLSLLLTIIFGACTKDNTTSGSCGSLVENSWCIDNVYYTQYIGDDYTSMSYDASAISPNQTTIEIDISDLNAGVTAGAYTFAYDPGNNNDSIPANQFKIHVYKGGSNMFRHKTGGGAITVTDDSGKRTISFNNESFCNILDTTQLITVSAKVRVR